MKRSFRRGAHFAKKSHIPSTALFETRLYKRFTHIGAKRRMKWMRNPQNPLEYIRSTSYDWGNFLSYAGKANRVMRSINQDDSILKQCKKIWGNFHKIKKETYKEIAKEIIRKQKI